MKTIITDLNTIIEEGLKSLETKNISKVYIFYQKNAQVPFSLMMDMQKIEAEIVTVETDYGDSSCSMLVLLFACQLAANGADVAAVLKDDYSNVLSTLEKTGQFVPFITVSSVADLPDGDTKPESVNDAVKEPDVQPVSEEKPSKKSAIVKKTADESAKESLSKKTETMPQPEKETKLKKKSAEDSKKAEPAKEGKKLSEDGEFMNVPEKDVNKSVKKEQKKSRPAPEKKEERYLTKNELPFFELSEKEPPVKEKQTPSIVEDDKKEALIALMRKYDEKNMEVYLTCFNQIYYIMKKSYNESDCRTMIDSFLKDFEPDMIKNLLLPHYDEFSKLFAER